MQKASDGILSLYTINARREGETLCFLPSLIFDAHSKLETFLSTGGNKILVDRLVRVTGVLVQEDQEPQDVYAALVGAGRYIRHFLGVRKAGPNVTLVASPQHGACEQFLRFEVHTRNNVGIAARSIVVANFGVDWDASAVALEVSESPAKRFKGMLDKYFSEATDARQAAQGSAATEAAQEQDKKTIAAAAREAAVRQAEAEASRTPRQGAKAEQGAKPQEQPATPEQGGKPQKDKDQQGAKPEDQSKVKEENKQNGEVLAVLADDCAVAGAMLVWRPEAGGSLSLRAPEGWAGNKKVPPKTTVWKVPDVKLDSKGEFFEWQLDGAKSMVFAGKGPTTLGEYVKSKGASSVARHTPESFPAGTAPNSLKATSQVRVGTTNLASKKVLASCSDNPHLGLMWMVGFKDQSKQVVPTGVVVFVKKQIIIPKDGEVRVS